MQTHTLGVGGNSVVTLISKNNRTYACKTLSKLDDKKCKNYKKEIEIMTKLRGKKHIVNLIDTEEDDENVYIIMEHCKGGDIKSYLGARDNFTENDVKEIVKRALNIVAKCHDCDIVHNDIKPENFLLKNPGDINSLTLIDFGISFEANESLRKDFVATEGTPWYMSVESLSSKTNKKSDVWSIGVMTHFLLTGSFPFNDKTNPFKPSIYKIWNSIIHDSIDFSKAKWKGISKEAQDFISKLLERDLDKRPTVYEALLHPWITVVAPDVSKTIGGLVVENFEKYSKKNIVMRTMFEDFVSVLLKNTRDFVIEKDIEDLEGSLYNSTSGIISLNSQRLSYILKVLDIKGESSLKKDVLNNVIKRLNSEKDLLGYVDRLIQGESLDINTLISSQIDWDYILENNIHFEKFLHDVFSTMDKNRMGKIRKSQSDLQNTLTLGRLFTNKSVLSFEEFMNNAIDVVKEEKGGYECDCERVHGGNHITEPSCHQGANTPSFH